MYDVMLCDMIWYDGMMQNDVYAEDKKTHTNAHPDSAFP
jgi:hypothetical protein